MAEAMQRWSSPPAEARHPMALPGGEGQIRPGWAQRPFPELRLGIE